MEPTEASSSPEISTAAQWKTSKRSSDASPLRVPSGNTALVRKVSVDKFLSSGWIPNPLLPIIQDMMRGRNSKTIADKAATDVQNILAMKQLMDRVVVECTEQPVVQPEPECIVCHLAVEDEVHHGVPHMVDEEIATSAHEYEPAARDEELLYVDEIEWEDKTAVYEFALSEASAAAPFHDEQTPSVEPVPKRKTVQRKTKQSSGSK